MSERDTFDRRLRAVERTITGHDHDLETLQETGELAQRVETLESSLEEAESRVAELEAATQALRGYVGNVRSVNEDVEQRADAALVAVDRLDRQFDGAISGNGAPAGEKRPRQRNGNRNGSPSDRKRPVERRKQRRGEERCSRAQSRDRTERSALNDATGDRENTGETVDTDETEKTGDRGENDGLVARLRASL